MVHAIANDSHKIFPCSCLLEGEYGLKDLCIGVPAKIGAQGIEEIVEIELNTEEQNKLEESAAAVQKTNGLL
jgi:malate dehydrogenase